jgi:hypothetical protein
MKQEIDELTDRETAWLAAQMKVAASLVNCYSPGDSEDPLSLVTLDRAYTAWVSSGPHDNAVINGIINAVGAALGQFLVDHENFRWVVATDDGGSELAVFALPGTRDVLVYPMNFAAKRFERGEVGFLNKSYERIAESTKSIAMGRGLGNKPWWKL